MKKMMKKLIAMAAALVMIVTLLPAVGVNAAGENPTVDFLQKGSITIAKTDASGDALNQGTFYIYKIADLQNVNGAQLNYEPVTSLKNATTPVTSADLNQLGTLSTSQLEAKATEYYDLVKNDEYKSVNGGGTVNGLDLGLYLVYEAVAPTDYTAGVPFFVDVPRTNDNGLTWDYNITVHPKNAKEDLNLTKTVDDQFVTPGQTISYTVSGSLAYLNQQQLAGEEAYILLDDTLTGDLTMDDEYYGDNATPLYASIENIKKIEAGEENVADNVQVTLKPAKNGFTLRIDGEDLKKYNGQKFTITYNVKVGETYTAGSDIVASNKATITSTANPDEGIPTPDVDVYTFAIQLTKKGSDGTTFGVGEAKFELYGATENGEFDANNKIKDEVSTDDKGQIIFDGLDVDENGTIYYLKETATKSGYTLLANPIKVTLTPVYDEVSDTYYVDYQIDDGTRQTENNDRIADVEVINNLGFSLPSTGGMGTYLFTIGGIVIMAGAAFALIAMKKRA